MNSMLRDLTKEMMGVYQLLGRGGNALKRIEGEPVEVTRALTRATRSYTMLTMELSGLMSTLLSLASSPSGLQERPFGLSPSLEETEEVILEMIALLDEVEQDQDQMQLEPEKIAAYVDEVCHPLMEMSEILRQLKHDLQESIGTFDV